MAAAEATQTEQKRRNEYAEMLEELEVVEVLNVHGGVSDSDSGKKKKDDFPAEFCFESLHQKQGRRWLVALYIF